MLRCTFQYLEAVTPPRPVSWSVGPVLFCLWPSNPVDGSAPQSPLPPPVKLVNGRERRSVAVEIGSEGTSERRTLSSSGCVAALLSASWATPVPVDSAAWRVQRCAPCNSSTGTSVTMNPSLGISCLYFCPNTWTFRPLQSGTRNSCCHRTSVPECSSSEG